MTGSKWAAVSAGVVLSFSGRVQGVAPEVLVRRRLRFTVDCGDAAVAMPRRKTRPALAQGTVFGPDK